MTENKDEEYIVTPEEEYDDGLIGGDPQDDYPETTSETEMVDEEEYDDDDEEEYEGEVIVEEPPRKETKKKIVPKTVCGVEVEQITTNANPKKKKKIEETYPKKVIDSKPKEAERWARQYDEYPSFTPQAVKEIFDMISKWHKIYPQDDVKPPKKGFFDFMSEKYGKSKEEKEKEEQMKFIAMFNAAMDSRENNKK